MTSREFTEYLRTTSARLQSCAEQASDKEAADALIGMADDMRTALSVLSNSTDAEPSTDGC